MKILSVAIALALLSGTALADSNTVHSQRQAQGQAQVQGQAQGQTQFANSSSNSASTSSADSASTSGASSDNSIVFEAGKRAYKNTPDVSLGGLFPSANCMGVANAGVSAAGFGVGGGKSYVDSQCQLREDARSWGAAAGAGYPPEMVAVLCQLESASAIAMCNPPAEKPVVEMVPIEEPVVEPKEEIPFTAKEAAATQEK